MASDTNGTCKTHGLVTGPDGTCVRCREEQSRSGARRVILGASAAFGVALLGLGAFWVLHDPEPTETITAPEVQMPTVSADPALLPDEPDPETTTAPAINTDNPWAEYEKDAAPEPTASAAPTDDEAKKRERERKIEAAMKKVPVTIYYSPTCATCQQALAWLKIKRIPHTARDVDASDSARRQWEHLSSGRSVPKLDIGGNVLEGFNQSTVTNTLRAAAEKRVDQGRY